MRPSIYTRPNKPKRVEVKRRTGAPERAALVAPPEPIMVDRATECHVTPPDVAELMVDCLDPCEDHFCLEAHAGTGNLISALIDNGHPPERITAVERNLSLVDVLNARFTDTPLQGIHSSCFFDYVEPDNLLSEPNFQRAIVNPPFTMVKRHMNAVIDLLSRSVTSDWAVVALVPITYNHEDAEVIKFLSNDTFALAKVNTKIIRIKS